MTQAEHSTCHKAVTYEGHVLQGRDRLAPPPEQRPPQRGPHSRRVEGWQRTNAQLLARNLEVRTAVSPHLTSLGMHPPHLTFHVLPGDSQSLRPAAGSAAGPRDGGEDTAGHHRRHTKHVRGTRRILEQLDQRSRLGPSLVTKVQGTPTRKDELSCPWKNHRLINP